MLQVLCMKTFFLTIIEINCFTRRRKAKTINKGVQLSSSLLSKHHYSRLTHFILESTSSNIGESQFILNALTAFSLGIAPNRFLPLQPKEKKIIIWKNLYEKTWSIRMITIRNPFASDGTKQASWFLRNKSLELHWGKKNWS